MDAPWPDVETELPGVTPSPTYVSCPVMPSQDGAAEAAGGQKEAPETIKLFESLGLVHCSGTLPPKRGGECASADEHPIDLSGPQRSDGLSSAMTLWTPSPLDSSVWATAGHSPAPSTAAAWAAAAVTAPPPALTALSHPLG